MYLQGDLQKVFDLLYGLGVIDPVLEKDWGEALQELPAHAEGLDQVIHLINHNQHNEMELLKILEQCDRTTLEYLGMEVAREFADFHTRKSLH